MLSSCFCSTVVSVCAMKCIAIGPLAQWGKDLTYYLTPFFFLVNWDMYYPGSACRRTDLPSGRILYIHMGIFTWFTPPGSYKAMIWREKESTVDHIHIFLTAQGHGGPPQMSDPLNAGTTSETTRALKTIHIIHSHIHSNKADMRRMIMVAKL